MLLETHLPACEKCIAAFAWLDTDWYSPHDQNASYRAQLARTWVPADMVSKKAFCMVLIFSIGLVAHEGLKRSWVLMKLETQGALQSSRAVSTARLTWLAWLAPWVDGFCSPLILRQPAATLNVPLFWRLQSSMPKVLVELKEGYWQEKLVWETVSLGWVYAYLYKWTAFL